MLTYPPALGPSLQPTPTIRQPFSLRSRQPWAEKEAMAVELTEEQKEHMEKVGGWGWRLWVGVRRGGVGVTLEVTGAGGADGEGG